MTHQDICEQLHKAKRFACVRLQECLPIIFQLGAKKIANIENGVIDCNIADLILYTQMCDVRMEIANWDCYTICSVEDLREALINEREGYEWSITEFAKRSHVSSSIIRAFEEGRCGLKIDTFIKLINALDAKVEIN